VSAAPDPRVIGFDLGETLLTYAETPLSWVAHYPAALDEVGRACGLQLHVAQRDAAIAILTRYNTRINPRRDEVSAAHIFAEILAAWSADPDRHGPIAITAFFRHFQQRLRAYPETIDVMTTLKSRGFTLGLLTDVPYGMPREFVERDLEQGRISGLVDLLLTSVEIGRRKPDPMGFQELAKRCSTATEKMWYVGNEEKDVVGAREAGAIAVLVDRENRQPSWGQHHTISDLRGLLERV
jgi:putative hydrolase of the HAD superfamily